MNRDDEVQQVDMKKALAEIDEKQANAFREFMKWRTQNKSNYRTQSMDAVFEWHLAQVNELEERNQVLLLALKKSHDKMFSWCSSEYAEHPDTKAVQDAIDGFGGSIHQFVSDRSHALMRIKELERENARLNRENNELTCSYIGDIDDLRERNKNEPK